MFASHALIFTRSYNYDHKTRDTIPLQKVSQSTGESRLLGYAVAI
jgi:hypothetical protein